MFVCPRPFFGSLLSVAIVLVRSEHVIGAGYCTNDDLDLCNSSNSALAASYSHVDGNQRQSEGGARCINSAANKIYLYLDWYRCAIYISTGIDAPFISRLA